MYLFVRDLSSPVSKPFNLVSLQFKGLTLILRIGLEYTNEILTLLVSYHYSLDLYTPYNNTDYDHLIGQLNYGSFSYMDKHGYSTTT